jgi:DNA-binding beta-propeller fold protein YncE
MRKTVLLLSLISAPSLAAQTYSVTHDFTLGGEGGWDYILPDAPRHRLFVARGNRFMVVDMNDGHLITEIKGFNGAHGTALVPEIGRGFATSGEDSSIIMFDMASYKPLLKIRAGDDADDIIYDPFSKRVYSFNGDANTATVVDPRRGTVAGTVRLGGKPEAGQSARNGKIYINLVDSSQIVEVDTKTMAVTRRWSTAPCKEPVSMAVDTRSARLFVGCRSGVLAVVDYTKGEVVTTLPIGQGVDGAGWDPRLRDIYTSNSDGTLTVIHQDSPNRYHVVESVQTGERGRTMGLDPATHRIYIPVAKFGPVPAESTATNPRRRAPMLPGSFGIVVVEPANTH